MLRTCLLGLTAGAVGLVAVPAMAADLYVDTFGGVTEPLAQRTVTGDLGLWGIWANPSDYKTDSDSDRCSGDGGPQNFCTDAWGFGGDARLYTAITDTFGLQFELLGEYIDSMATGEDRTETGELDNPLIHLAGGVHLISRHNPGLPFGAFFGLSGTEHIADDDSGVHVFGGLEAAVVGSAATLMGQAGWVQRVDGDDTMENLLFGRLEARYFFNENSRLAGSVAGGYSFNYNHDGNGDEEAAWVQFAASFEQAIADSPVSWFVGYQGDYVDATEEVDESVWVNAVKFGLRMTFGDTLQAENDDGARTFTFTNLSMPIGLSGELN